MWFQHIYLFYLFIFFQFPRLFWNNILWNCLHCTSPTLQNYDLLGIFWPDLDRAKTRGSSGSETLFSSEDSVAPRGLVIWVPFMETNLHGLCELPFWLHDLKNHLHLLSCYQFLHPPKKFDNDLLIRFSKKIECNWTEGYSYKTALILSVTLGGFGADR